MVYVVINRTTYHVKIGYARTIKNAFLRLKDFQVANHVKLEMLALFSDQGNNRGEKAMHNLFNEFRVSGEWFECDSKLLGFISVNALCYGHNECLLALKEEDKFRRKMNEIPIIKKDNKRTKVIDKEAVKLRLIEQAEERAMKFREKQLNFERLTKKMISRDQKKKIMEESNKYNMSEDD